jgi:hypothetical protein
MQRSHGFFLEKILYNMSGRGQADI